MKVVIVAALLAVASASFQKPGPTEADQPPHSLAQAAGPSVFDQAPHSLAQAPGPVQGFDPAPDAARANALIAPSNNEASLNEANAKRQHKVNYQALHFGAGVGTAPYYGVPGTAVKGQHNSGVYHHGPYGHHGAYGYGHHGAYGGGYGHGYHGGYGHGYGGFRGGYYGVGH